MPAGVMTENSELKYCSEKQGLRKVMQAIHDRVSGLVQGFQVVFIQNLVGGEGNS